MTRGSLPPVHEWLDQWSELEGQLARWLLQPHRQAGFVPAVLAVHEQLVAQLEADADSTLYWLLQQAATSSAGYSCTHATVCASLCHLVAPVLGLSAAQRDSLGLAALTMNVAMTRLQDQLATQDSPPTPEQRDLIERHAETGAQWLAELGVSDADWLHAVAHHHDDQPGLLPRILAATDRYAALLSPREYRSGRCVTDSARQVVVGQGSAPDEVGHALLRAIGLCPPGTFVRLEDERIAVVLRRGSTPGTPWVVPVLDAGGLPLADYELLDTSLVGQGVAAALITRTVSVRLNHQRLLQQARRTALAPA